MCSCYDVRGMERLYIDWKKAIRQVWKLPYRTHNSILPHIRNSVPPDIMLHKRCIPRIWLQILHLIYVLGVIQEWGEMFDLLHTNII